MMKLKNTIEREIRRIDKMKNTMYELREISNNEKGYIVLNIHTKKGLAYGEQESLRNHGRKVYIEEVNNEHR